MKNIQINIKDQSLIFDSRKFIFWKENATLIISDLHIGKITHFIKNGIPLPYNPVSNNLKILKSGIDDYQPKNIIFLGDLFHSNYNSEWDEWLIFFEETKIDFNLVLGNHDKVNIGIKCLITMSKLDLLPFNFTHFPNIDTKLINMCGHIHPAFRIRGNAKQTFKLPCFYISKKQIILPSYGEFTGSHLIDFKSSKDQILVISPSKIYNVNSNTSLK